MGYDWQLKQPVNSKHIFELDNKKMGNPSNELNAKLIQPSPIDPKTDLRIMRLDTTAYYNPAYFAEQANKHAKPKLRFSEKFNMNINEIKNLENKFYGTSIENAMRLKKIDAKLKEKI